MSYYRLYCTKTNTIFRYLDQVNSSFPIDPTTVIDNQSNWSVFTNNGANPIMELHDGRSESKLLFGFDIPDWLYDRINNFQYSVKLFLFDSGTLFNPPIKLKNLKLNYFTDDFVEGDGFSFLQPKNKKDVSNFLYRDSQHSWEDVTFTNVSYYQLQRINEDLQFDVKEPFVVVFNNEEDSTPRKINFSLEVDNKTTDTSIYTKFIYGNNTRTVFQPYIEFVIDDSIQDTTYSFYSDTTNKLHLLNQLGKPFIGTVSCKVTINSTDTTYTTTDNTNIIHNPAPGVYYLQVNPGSVTSNKSSYANVLWTINGVDLFKQMIEILNINQIDNRLDIINLHFYPSSSYSHNIVKQGDVIPFIVVSEIRGKGKVFSDGYDYRILSVDGFEICPWTSCSIYRDKIYFNVNTSYLYPETEYEVFVRISNQDGTITSPLTYRFKVLEVSQSRLRELNASPYFNREYFNQK